METRKKLMVALRSQKTHSGNKSVVILQHLATIATCEASFVTTSPLQVVNKLVAIDCVNLVSTNLLQVVSTSCTTCLQMTSCNEPDFNRCNLVKPTSLLQRVDNQQQDGELVNITHHSSIHEYVAFV